MSKSGLFQLGHVVSISTLAVLGMLLQATSPSTARGQSGASNNTYLAEPNSSPSAFQTSHATVAAPPQLESYPVSPATQFVFEQYQTHYAGRSDVRIAVDPRTAQVLVFAPAEVHQQLRQSLAAAESAAAGPAAPATAGAVVQLPGRRDAQTGRLRTLGAEQLHDRLEKALRRPLPATWVADGSWLQFPLEAGPQATTIAVHRDSHEFKLEGPATRAVQWRHVIEALDAPQQQGQSTIRLVPTTRQNRTQVRQVLHLLQNNAQREDGPEADPNAAYRAERQEDGQAVGLTGPSDSVFSELLGPVEITYVEGLDTILIRGRQEDVERVQQIIEEIERASRIAAPTVRVQPLRHVDSLAIAALLERLYTDVLTARVGSVHITPLGKPNALLLIGRDENIATAIDLIDKLDQPVEPNTRFRVFQLQYAAALDLLPMVEQLLTPTEAQEEEEVPNLLPSGRVVADFRTNSLVVIAGPRDLAEVEALIKRVDTPGGEVRDLIRVIPLRNTIASELADVMQNAIQAQAGALDGAAAGETRGRSTALELVTIDAEQQEVVRSGILTGVRITADQRTNSLVVSATAESMPLVEALIKQLDKAPEVEAAVKVFTLKEGDAEGLAETVQQLFGADQDETAVGGFGASESALVRLQLSVDRRTNSIIAVGSTEDLEVLEALLYRLDTGDVSARVNEVYQLKNAQADAVALTLQTWLETRREAEIDAELDLSPFEIIEREVIVVPEAASNSLLISATPTYIDEIRRIIQELDEQPPMVMIQVLIAEVALNDTDEFGVELGLQDSLLFDRSVIGIQEFQTITNSTQTTSAGGAVISTETEEVIINSPLNPGFNFNSSPLGPLGSNGSATALANAGKVAAQGLSNFALSRVNSDLGFSGLVLSASSSAVNAMLRALQEKRRLEVLSRPQIMAMDGQPARVQVGEDVPTIAGVTFTALGQQQNTIEYRSVGLILDVIPRISPDGLVVMQITAEKSRVGDISEGVPVAISDGESFNAPRIELTQAFTTVSAASGQTIVLGGLLTKETFDVHRRVPLIADIPLLGDMFRYDLIEESRTELLIILTPRVVYSKFDAEMIKQVESARMSWVLSDVVNMHGTSGLRSRCDEWYEGECESVYPDYVPADGEVVPRYEEVLPLDQDIPIDEGNSKSGPALESAIPKQPDALGSAERRTDSQVEPTSYGQPTRLPPTNST